MGTQKQRKVEHAGVNRTQPRLHHKLLSFCHYLIAMTDCKSEEKVFVICSMGNYELTPLIKSM